MESVVKLVITDLDGTLLDDEKHIPKENVSTLVEAIRLGVHVSVATGRNFHSARRYVEELGLSVPVIFQNGAFVYKWPDGHVLHQVALASSVAQNLVSAAREFGVFYILYSGFLDERDMYVDQDYQGAFSNYLDQNEWRLNFVRDVFDVLALRESVAEVAIVGPEELVLKAIARGLSGSEHLASVVKNNFVGGETFYEVFGPGSSKEDAFRFLLGYFNVKPEETMYIGDSFNDIGLLKLVGYPVVVENGHEEVKRYARFITKSNNEAGVAHAVRELVLRRIGV